MPPVPSWIDPAMRFGFAARGGVYLIVALLALAAALLGGAAEGTKGALEELLRQPFGQLLLGLVALGLLAYALYRVLSAVLDLDCYGRGFRGIAARLGMAASALTHAALAFYALSLIWRLGGNGGGEEALTAGLMAQPFGLWLVGLTGAAVVAAGGYYALKALRETYRRRMRLTPGSRRLEPVIKCGLVAYGLVIAMVGGFLLWAALTADPSKAGGLDDALETLRAAPFGRLLLGLAGAGLLSFGVYCFAEARYRVAPRIAPAETETLAGRALGAGG